MIHDAIYLRVNKSNVSGDLDNLIEKLREMEKPRIYIIIDLEKKVIEINGETNLEQDYSSKLICF